MRGEGWGDDIMNFFMKFKNPLKNCLGEFFNPPFYKSFLCMILLRTLPNSKFYSVCKLSG